MLQPPEGRERRGPLYLQLTVDDARLKFTVGPHLHGKVNYSVGAAHKFIKFPSIYFYDISRCCARSSATWVSKILPFGRLRIPHCVHTNCTVTNPSRAAVQKL